MKPNLVVLPTPLTSEERIQMQIERFRKEMLGHDISTENIEDLLGIIIEYLSEYESDPLLEQAYIKLNESFFWLSSFNSDI
jgi:chorismate mutase